MKLILIRHPKTVALEQRLIYGQSESELNEEGKASIPKVAKHLAKEDPAAIYSSPLKRCLDLAQAAAKEHGMDVIVDPRIIELSCGAYENMTFEEALEKGGEDAHRFVYEFASYRPEGGENFDDLKARTGAFLDELAGRAEEFGDKPVLIFTHGIATRAMLSNLLELSMEQLWHINVEPSNIVRIDYDPEHRFGRLIGLEDPDRL